MLRSFSSIRALQLAGTVSIPTPFPEPGWISLGRIFDATGTLVTCVDVVRVEHALSNRVMVVRTVCVKDLEAVWLADDKANLRKHRSVWVERHCFLRLLRKLAPRKLAGSVFVKEAASVLLEVQSGMTAAEAAQYYPPVIRRDPPVAPRVNEDPRDCHRWPETAVQYFESSETDPLDCHRCPPDAAVRNFECSFVDDDESEICHFEPEGP